MTSWRGGYGGGPVGCRNGEDVEEDWEDVGARRKMTVGERGAQRGEEQASGSILIYTSILFLQQCGVNRPVT